MTPPRGPRVVALLLAVGITLLGTPGLSTAAARTEERRAMGAGALAVRIAALEPAVPGPADRLEVRGTLTNVSDQSVGSVSVTLRVSPTPLVNRAEIPEVLAGEGRRTGVAIPATLQDLAADLPAGQSRDFRLSVDMSDLGLSTSGVYVTGVEALGDTGSGTVRQDIDRTFLPWWPDDAVGAPLLLTTVWPLTEAPISDARGVLLDEAPAVSMSPAGRLSRLLNAAAASPGSVTMTLDPEVVLTAAQMADGYRVRPPGSDPEPGTRAREVSDWLDRLRSAVAAPGAQVTGSLYALPDIDAVRRGNLMARMLSHQASVDARAAEILGTDVPGTLVLAPGGVAHRETLAALAREKAGAVLLGDDARPLAETTFFTPSGNVTVPTAQGELPGLLADSGLAETLAMPMDSPAEQVAVRQALLAHTLVAERELPATERLLVAAPDPWWDPPADGAGMVISALTDAPWVTPTSVRSALRREPSSVARIVVAPTVEETALELSEAHVADVADLYRDLQQYSAVVPDPDLVPEVTRTAPTRLLGSWYRSQSVPLARLTTRVTAQVGSLIESVQVVSSGSITVAGTSGAIPITVENRGPNPVSVGLVLNSTPRQLVQAEPVEPFTIEPGRRTSVVVTAQVAAGGPIPVDVQLVTSTGRSFGDPGRLVVQSSAYANAARVLVRVALAALVITVAVHGVRRARRRRAAAASTQAVPSAGEDASG